MSDDAITLDTQLLEARRTISTDSYPISIGELTSMFKDGDLIIRPAFQRLFRWESGQKSRLIESILLGIPIPSVFVSQDENGRWEVVDGLQRISTLLQLQGLLKEDEFPPLVLEGTKYLPSLEGKMWTSEDPKESFTEAQQRDIKRAKLDVKIIKRESDSKTKYDLFQRLNSFGTALTSQEIRNAMLVGINPDFSEWLQGLAETEEFTSLTKLADADISRKYDEELVLRFLWLHGVPDEEAERMRNFQDGLESFSVDLAENFEARRVGLQGIFDETFSKLSSSPDVFRRWNPAKGEFSGGFLNTAFEVIGIGLGTLVARGDAHRSDFEQVAKELWAQEDMAGGFATGKSTERRLQTMLPKGRELLRARP